MFKKVRNFFSKVDQMIEKFVQHLIEELEEEKRGSGVND
jgi:hypothetical protein